MLLSIVIPCLNEEETISICIEKCFKTFKKLNLDNQAEVIIADNGCTDDSIKIAEKLGARTVYVNKKGYGSAIIGGIQEAKGKYIIMGDADNSYDFNEIDKIFLKLMEGNDLVQGCRFPIGGGKILKNAMPLSHKYFGNPFFSFISKLFFSLPFNDVYCGLRGFDKIQFNKLNHFSSGMVFAIENLVKFSNAKLKCAEIPITLHKDGRIKNKSHLNTISDGWKTLRFLLIACPKWLYFIPSFIFLLLSIISLANLPSSIQQTLNYLPEKVDFIIFNKITTVFIFFMLSFQSFMFGIFSSLQASKLKIHDYSSYLKYFFKIFKLKYVFLIGFIITVFVTFKDFVFNIFNFDEKYFEIIINFSIFFVIMLTANSLFISLLNIENE